MMVRGKTQIKRIEKASSRLVTFSKRRKGLVKKAFELSVLCDVEVGLVVFSPSGKLYQFASSSMQSIIDRYLAQCRNRIDTSSKGVEQNIQQCKHEASSISKKIELLEVSKQKLLGEKLETSSFRELCELEVKLEKSICRIKGRKYQLLDKEIVQLEERERDLNKKNADLRKKCKLKAQLPQAVPLDIVLSGNKYLQQHEVEKELHTTKQYEVETELYIGCPGRRATDKS